MVTYEDHGYRYWYDPSLRLWTITEIDEDGHQVGDADYQPNREKLTEIYPELDFTKTNN